MPAADAEVPVTITTGIQSVKKCKDTDKGHLVDRGFDGCSKYSEEIKR